MTMRIFNRVLVALLVILSTFACSKNKVPAAKENVEQALKQSGLTAVNVDEDRDKGVVTLKGDVRSDEEKQRAGQVAQSAAPGKVVANEIGVRPEGMESTAQKVQSNTDDAIEDHFKAVIAANHWENQHIRFDAKNGVLTLKGDVDTAAQRAKAEKSAAAIPGVQQVVNELTVKGKKG
jgi:hyperosmotically inducible protein